MGIIILSILIILMQEETMCGVDSYVQLPYITPILFFDFLLLSRVFGEAS